MDIGVGARRFSYAVTNEGGLRKCVSRHSEELGLTGNCLRGSRPLLTPGFQHTMAAAAERSKEIDQLMRNSRASKWWRERGFYPTAN